MTWLSYHQESETLASQAEVALHCGYDQQARQLYARAADAETAALLLTDPGKTRTYAITAVSAASLHYKAGQAGSAQLVMREARRHSELPSFARNQLDEIEDLIAADQHTGLDAALNADSKQPADGCDDVPKPPNEIVLTTPLAYVDTEWTELDPESRRLVSIAVTRFNPDGSRQSAYWLVNPQRRISEQSSRIHGIRHDDVAKQPPFRKIANEVAVILEEADIAGYSVANDIEIIEKEMALAGKQWTATGRRIVDAYRLWQVREPRKLSDAHRRFVGPVPDHTRAHDARHDVNMTIAVVNAMQNHQTVTELHQEAHADMVDPAGKFRKEAGRTVFNFGPFRGMPVADHPEYLEWMLSKSFAPSTVEETRALLADIQPDESWDYDDEPLDDDEFDEDEFDD